MLVVGAILIEIVIPRVRQVPVGPGATARLLSLGDRTLILLNAPNIGDSGMAGFMFARLQGDGSVQIEVHAFQSIIARNQTVAGPDLVFELTPRTSAMARPIKRVWYLENGKQIDVPIVSRVRLATSDESADPAGMEN
jgi:hypothetical protein